MRSLILEDVEQIVNLVAEVSDPTVDHEIPQRRRKLAEGICQLIDADVWMWSTAVMNPSAPGDAMTTCFLDGGWRNEAEQVEVYRALTGPDVRPLQVPLTDAISLGQYKTFLRKDLFTPEVDPHAVAAWSKTGLDALIITIFPLEKCDYSSVAFHRRRGRPAFTERDRDIVHVILHQVEWLHRHAADFPSKGKVVELSPRERQVLVLLLSGNSRKEIAKKLGISEHTVGDYMKQLHKHFSVSSRAELQAYFLIGGQKLMEHESSDERE